MSTSDTRRRGINAVVFDLGNVLVRWDPYLPYVGRMERMEVETFFDDIDFPSFNHRQDAGRSWEKARADVRARFPQHVAALDIYRENFAAAVPGPVEGSEAVVRELAAGGIRVLGLTNWSAETYHHAEPAAPAIGLLEGVLVSGEEGIAKPDPTIFALLGERFDLEPGRTTFVDDASVNVDAASVAGYDAVLFESASQLRRDLHARGLPVALPGSRG